MASTSFIVNVIDINQNQPIERFDLTITYNSTTHNFKGYNGTCICIIDNSYDNTFFVNSKTCKENTVTLNSSQISSITSYTITTTPIITFINISDVNIRYKKTGISGYNGFVNKYTDYDFHYNYGLIMSSTSGSVLQFKSDNNKIIFYPNKINHGSVGLGSILLKKNGVVATTSNNSYLVYSDINNEFDINSGTYTYEFSLETIDWSSLSIGSSKIIYRKGSDTISSFEHQLHITRLDSNTINVILTVGSDTITGSFSTSLSKIIINSIISSENNYLALIVNNLLYKSNVTVTTTNLLNYFMLMGCIYDASTPNLCLTQASLSRFRYSKNDYYNINSFSDGANINTENLHIQCPIKFDKQIDKSVYISTYNTCSITQLGNTSEISTIISEK